MGRCANFAQPSCLFAVSHITRMKRTMKVICPHWPYCPRGQTCPLVHPTRFCYNDPCAHATNCTFIHPAKLLCPFGDFCALAVCPFRHDYHAPWWNPPPPRSLSIPCPSFPGCPRKSACPFIHSSTICRDGALCARPSCTFLHPRALTERKQRECPAGAECHVLNCPLLHRVQTCWHWAKRGRCDFGDGCSFRHDDVGMCDRRVHDEMEAFVNAL